MKRWIVTGGLVAWALAAILLVTFAFTRTDPVTTEDIDAIMDPSEKRLDEASFILGVSKDEVVERALRKADEMFETVDTSTLETRATVGLYTGKDNQGQQVERMQVWLVVVDNLPMVFPSGPAGSSVDRSGQRQQNQLVVFFNADTGEEVEGSISGRWVGE